jgi:glycerophosphoryl diester phosphodiesterase
MNRLLCIGHRGACGYEPENTLRSFRRALEFGVDGIEFDVQLAGGQLVVLHDSRVDRTTNGRGYLRRKSFAQVRVLDAGKGEQIPTLQEVCDLVDRRAFLNIELKGKRTARPVAEMLAELVEQKGWSPQQLVVSSFHRAELKEFRAIARPDLPLGLLLNRPTPLWRRAAHLLGATSVHPPSRFVTRHFVDEAHRLGLKVFVYTVNTPAAIQKMRGLGVDGVFTDFPDRVLAGTDNAEANVKAE